MTTLSDDALRRLRTAYWRRNVAIMSCLLAVWAFVGLRTPWFFDIDAQGIGTVGMVLNFVVTVGLTPFCAAPSDQVRAMVDSIREPEGVGDELAVVGH